MTAAFPSGALAAVDASDFSWRPPKNAPPFNPPPAFVTQKDLSRALAANQLIDAQAIPLQGATVVLPEGLALVERTARLVEDSYAAAGFGKYEYPALIPSEGIELARGVFDVLPGVLHVVGGAGAERVGSLCPSGEEVIYPHWKRLLRSSADLPLRMYRRATFFRGTNGRSGQGLFRSMEARDVFEFHSCFGSRREGDEAFEDYGGLLAEVVQKFHLPALFSTRPLAGNNADVSLRTLAADVFLPIGSSVQVACLYQQGDIFSRVFGIRFLDGNEWRHTHHVTGAVSRRLLYAHLLLGMNQDGSFLVHPAVAPHDVVIVTRPETREEAMSFGRALGFEGLRARSLVVKDRREQQRVVHAALARGAPVVAQFFPPRFLTDPVRVVATRADTRCDLDARQIGCPSAGLVRALAAAVEAVGDAYDARARAFTTRHRHRLTHTTEAEVETLLGERGVIECPMVECDEHVLRVAGWRKGEVLGFTDATVAAPCVFSGAPTTRRAHLAPRL